MNDKNMRGNPSCCRPFQDNHRMKIFPLFAIPAALLLFSCAGRPGPFTPLVPISPGTAETPRPYIISDSQERAGGIPEWVGRYLEGGIHETETLDAFEGRFAFVSRNEGNNFAALSQWAAGFSAALDFPRLASSRIEARFLQSVPYPDNEYGPFFEELIRAASDSSWDGAGKGAEKTDEFWIRKSYMPLPESASGNPDGETLPPSIPQMNETYEFLILVTIEKEAFASRFDKIFNNVNPERRPSKEQMAAAARVKEKFYDGF